jgi:hypothetical protein
MVALDDNEDMEDFDFGDGTYPVSKSVIAMINECRESYSHAKWTPTQLRMVETLFSGVPRDKWPDVRLKVGRMIESQMQSHVEMGNAEEDMLSAAIVLAAYCEMDRGKVIMYFNENWPEINQAYVWEDEDG